MKHRIGKTAVLAATGLAVLLCCIASPVTAQTVEPAWLLVERGEKLLTEGEFGRALQVFRSALQMQTDYPEALYGIGRAYKSILDYDIAIRYLADALALSDRFEVPDTFFPASYDLAEIYRVRRLFADYERVLFEIVEQAPELPGAFDIDDMKRAFRDRGLDRMLVLYRIPQDGSLMAHSKLSELLVGLGRNATAVHHALIAVTQQLSTVIAAVIDRDPTYEFSTVGNLFTKARLYTETRDYLETATIYHDLYYLAAALWAQGDTGRARILWNLASNLADGGEWSERSSVQVHSPRAEPLLVVD